MKLKDLKATLLVAFIFLTAALTYLGLKSDTANIDFKKLQKERDEAMSRQSESSFENVLKNIGSSTTVVKPDVLQSSDTSRLSMSIELLDSMKQYTYAAVLSEKLANIQQSAYRFHAAARLFIKATEKHENELMLFKQAKKDLEKSLELNPGNLDAKVDLSICVYNVNLMQPTQNTAEIMRPTLLLREVIQTDSNHIDALYYLGKLSIESNQYEKAIGRFKKLVSLQPQNLEFYYELIETYKKMGNEKEAKVWADKALTVSKNKK